MIGRKAKKVLGLSPRSRACGVCGLSPSREAPTFGVWSVRCAVHLEAESAKRRRAQQGA